MRQQKARLTKLRQKAHSKAQQKVKYQALHSKRSATVKMRGRMRLTDDGPVIPVIPTHGKRERRVNEALSKPDVTTRYWQEGNLEK
jgi:hypothetical protein